MMYRISYWNNGETASMIECKNLSDLRLIIAGINARGYENVRVERREWEEMSDNLVNTLVNTN